MPYDMIPGSKNKNTEGTFSVGVTWNDTFEKVMMAVVLAYFGGRTTEKATKIFKSK